MAKEHSEYEQAANLVAQLRPQTIDQVVLGDASLLPGGIDCFCDGALRLVTLLEGQRPIVMARAGHSVNLELRPGQWLLLLPHAPMWTGRNSHCHHFGLRFGALGTRLHATRHPLPPGPRVPYLALDMPPLPNPVGAIVQALSETLEESSESQACRRSLIAALLPILARSLDFGQPIGEHSAWQFRRICSYVQENLHHAIDRNSVARHFELAPSTLSRLFSKVGPGFNTYLNELRIDMARQLLCSSNKSVEAVAQACGFTTSSYFIKRFRQYLGCTPQQWRTRQVGN